MTTLNDIIQWCKEVEEERVVPEIYLYNCWRRLAETPKDIIKDDCWFCKHNKGYEDWKCELKSCKWSPCYTRTQITKSDFIAGSGTQGGWVWNEN